MRISLTCILAALPLLLPAADWPGWRGPDRTDLSSESGLRTSWPEDGPRQHWVFPNAGIGYSGPAIVNGRLYTMGYRDGREELICLDTATGKEQWKRHLGEHFENKWGDGPRGTPSVHAGRVYALGARGDLLCADATTGKQLWKKSLLDEGGTIENWGYTESPLVEGDLLIVSPGGSKTSVVALDLQTGEVRWRSKSFTNKLHYSSPIAFSHGGKRVIAKLFMDKLVGLDAATGNTLWESPWEGKTAVIPTPIYHDGHIFISSGYGIGCKLVALGDGSSATDVWVNKEMKNHHGGVILLDGNLYGYSDGIGWTCIDWKTGERQWSEKKALGKGAIAYADGHFYCLDEKTGDLALIEATPKKWTEKSRFTLSPQTKLRKPSGRIWTHPVILNGRLYLRDQELLHCYDLAP